MDASQFTPARPAFMIDPAQEIERDGWYDDAAGHVAVGEMEEAIGFYQRLNWIGKRIVGERVSAEHNMLAVFRNDSRCHGG